MSEGFATDTVDNADLEHEIEPLPRVVWSPAHHPRTLHVELLPTPRVWVAVVRAAGSLDVCTAARFKKQIRTFVQCGQRRLVLDASDLAYVDSTGLSALIAGVTATRRVGGDLHLARVNPYLVELLRVSELDRVLVAHASVEQAVDAFA